MKNRVRAAIVAAIVLLPASAGAQILTQSSAQPRPGITVTGTGYDRAALVNGRVVAQVLITSKQPFTATMVEPIVDALKEGGVANVTITNTPNILNQPITVASIGGPASDLSHLETLQATVQAAASTIPGANFTELIATGHLPNCSDAQQRATIDAIRQARARATALAAAAGVRLGKLTALGVVQSQSLQADGTCSVTTTLGPPGRFTIPSSDLAVTVTMTFAIK
jgi:uncharacterized protein YggE